MRALTRSINLALARQSHRKIRRAALRPQEQRRKPSETDLFSGSGHQSNEMRPPLSLVHRPSRFRLLSR